MTDIDPLVAIVLAAEEQAVFDAGKRAAREGKPIEANPHAERTDPWFSWRCGWRESFRRTSD